MWFIFVGIGLALVTVCGLYARRRLTQALTHFGVRSRRTRIVRWLVVWLLFGYPLLVIVAVVLSRLLGQATIPRLDGVLASFTLGIPFILTVLVVLQSIPWLLALDLAYLVVRRRPGVERLRAIGIVVVFGAFALYTPTRILVERGDVRMRHFDVGPGATPAAPLRIAFLADIQQDAFTDSDRARELFAAVNATKPDLVLSGGDWINTGPDEITASAAAAGTLRSKLGTFSVRGDHEHFAYVDRNRSVREIEAAMKAHGVEMLANEVRWFDHDGKRIAVVFLNYNYIVRTDATVIASLLAVASTADYSIVVTHQLDRQLAAMLEDKVDLVLAGHTHGGQVNPVIGIVHVPLARLETRFIDGRYKLGHRTDVIVTAGIGYSIVPIRYAAPGSIETIDLRL
ncbi:MAG: hypothetical protein HOV81_37185 [Kofleriaceae bacterium]|nr:hypothetical protein [Kofleriaceae bacterium]